MVIVLILMRRFRISNQGAVLGLLMSLNSYEKQSALPLEKGFHPPLLFPVWRVLWLP